ncbi:MAG: hypothetical protein A3H27_09005 [Acidobacteria bacterium RIFCSPLOWO2_02_FULL_59_13]|nr:MAG: hypothetical protein A3H27_09005 [Acidobacteria bacterium RIFCSPLOWO2_02_FULL_59_13]
MAQAIQTRYRGRNFRSRLEAKWAVFMDHMGVKWEYEPEGFADERGGRYLPDFFLPDLNCFLEIKPRKPTDQERDKAWIAVEATGKDLFILWGEPEDPWNVLNDSQRGCYGLFRSNRNPKGDEHYEEWFVSDDRYWAWCPACNTVGIVLSGATEKLRCCPKNPGHSLAPVDHEKILQAADKARNYRFGKIA